MKKLFSYLLTLVILLFIAATFYVLEIYPFNPGGPIIEEKIVAHTTTNQPTDTPLPDFLDESKVGRATTYGEHLKRGALLFEQGYVTLAITEYEKAAKLQPAIALPLIEIGNVNFSIQDYVKSKLNYEEALKIEPNNLTAKIGLGKTLLATRKIDEAKAVFDSIQIHNQTSKYYHGLSLAFIGDADRAKAVMREVMDIGTSGILTANAQKVLSAYDEWNSYQGGSPLHLKSLLARSFIQCHENEIAIPLLFDVIKEKKDYRDAWILLGYAYLNTEKYQDSIDALNEARKLDPEKSQTPFFLGLAYYGIGDLNNAIAMLQIAKKNGYEPASYIDQKLAEIYLQLQDFEKSAESYENLLSKNDSSIDHFIRPIWIYIDKLNEPQKAITLAEKAVKTHPSSAMSYNLLGWSYVGAGQLMSAQMYLDKAHAMDANLDAVYLNYGKLYQKKGQTENAIINFKKAYELGKGNSVSLTAADLYNQLINQSATLQADIINQ